MSNESRASLGRALAAGGGLASAIGAGLLLGGIGGPWAWIALAGGAFAIAGGALPARAGGSAAFPPASRAPAPVRAAAVHPPVEELSALRSELESHKKLEQELTAAKHAAEAAMMAKGEFLATMSHEIRTPLNGIIPLLDILLSSSLGPDQREYVQTAYGSARQLLRIVDDILDYSKLEANKLELETVGLNLKELLEGVIRLMEKAAEAKGLKLALNIDPGVRLAVRGDPVRLRQVLTNLVSNAIKFTERGGVTIAVQRRGETRTQHELRFEVRDSGVGMSPETAAKLFQPFSQADASTTRTFGGTGLGLVICKRIVDLMGGTIGVESEPGRGSKFWFHIPLLKALGDIGSGRSRSLQGARALVLSSDPQQMRRFSVSLPLWGATPVPASNTQEALNKLRATAARSESWGFQLLLVDLPSVRTTALGLHRNLQREAGLDELRIIYLQGDELPPPEIATGGRVLVVPRTTADTDLRPQLQRLLEMEINATPIEHAPLEPAPGVAVDPEAPLRGHVLLVEDNPVNRQVAQRLLSLSGLTLDAAENGKEALDALNAALHHYDAVLMDCQMPVMDGYTATRKRRQHEQAHQLGRIPIIAMTANAMVGDREKCLEAGMDDYLSKPLNRGLMEQTLRRWIRPTAARPQPMPAAAAPAALAHKAPAAPVHAATAVTDAPQAPVPQSPAMNTPAPVAAPTPKPAPTATGPAINREIVDDLREIMGGEFASLVRVFLEDAPRSLTKLETAAADGDVDGLVGPAHSLKSTSANLGAMELSAQAKAIEHGARQRSLSDPGIRVASLQHEFQRVDAALRALLN